MQNERILAYQVAQKLTEEDINTVGGGEVTARPTGQVSGNTGGWDTSVDYKVDF